MSKEKKSNELILPALRGVMGRWVFYSCLMGLDEIGHRVKFADEIHKNKNLSDMIQRRLKTSRSKQIAEYIRDQDERLFNSLVIATYGGQPNWSSLDSLSSKGGSDFVSRLSEETVNSVGFLSLTGEEKLFALDGQHRLSGIKKAIGDGLDQDPVDDLSVIFVGHKNHEKGLERTRRLFTTLNKTAKPVSKGDTIALDEDDVMALTVRWLIEETPLFSGERVAFVATNNMPVKNSKSLTTIVNLYDVVTILFTGVNTELKKPKTELQRVRPSDDELSRYFDLAKTFFEALAEHFEPVKEFFEAEDTSTAVKKHRGEHGGNALYRPIGLKVMSEVIAKISQKETLEKAIERCGKLPTDLSDRPFEGLMWNSASQRITNNFQVTLREVLLGMLGV